MALQNDPILIDLLIGGRRGAFYRVVPKVLKLSARHLYEEFRESSRERGMAMEDVEIRQACWAPLAARLVGEAKGGDPEDSGFTEMALCFLVTAAYARPVPGEQFAVAIAEDGTVEVTRKPRRLLGRNSVRLGNYLESMNRVVPAMATER